MFKITKDEIKDLATNFNVYSRGLAYYHKGKVKNSKYSEENMTIDAVVLGNQRYHVHISVDSEGEINSMKCTCPAFRQYSDACKHIVAVLLESIDQKGMSSSYSKEVSLVKPSVVLPKNQEQNYALSRELISTIVKNLRPTHRTNIETVNVKVTFFKSQDLNTPAHIELEIGTVRFYNVSKITDLLDAIQYEKDLYFGIQFVFSCVRHTFRQSDQPLMNMLMDIYNEEKNSMQGSYNSSFNKKKFYLKATKIRGFLEIAEKMQDVYCKSSFSSISEKISVCRDRIPVELNLVQGDKSVELVLNTSDSINDINPAKDVYIIGNRFYLPSKDEIKKILPILKSFSKSGKKTLPISNEDAVIFISEVAPALKQVCTIKVSEQIQNRFYKEPLVVSIWFDRYREGISAKVVFKYGETVINPLEKNNLQSEDNRLLLRETYNEEDFLYSLSDNGLVPYENQYYLSSEEKIFEFLTVGITSLAEKAEIYYSESFGRLKLSNPPRFSGAIRLDAASDLLEVSFSITGIEESELTSFLSALKERKRFFRLKNGSFIPMDNPEILAASELVEQLGLTDGDIGKKLVVLPKCRALYLDNAIGEYGKGHFTVDSFFKKMVHSIKEPQELNFEIPESLSGILRDYQKDGYNWLKALSYYGFGGILADDMGLGKTLQAIAFIKSNYDISKLPSLIVVPTSLVYNWQEEIVKFAPELPVAVMDGHKHERISTLTNAMNSAFVIISYPLLRRDIAEIKDIQFEYCFLDEAQQIKNPDTINARSVKQIKARGYFAMTGTPIENSLTELWSIFDFIMQGYLYSKHKFATKFEIPIIKNRDTKALKDLSEHVRPFLLRRMKSDVLAELPEKIETKSICEMTEAQKKVYLSYLSKAKSEFEEEVQRSSFTKSKMKIIALLTRLRQICCHPSLFIDNYTGGSGKLDLLNEILSDALEGGHRILLFSQFTSMLAIIGKQLQKKGINYFYLDGQTPPQERLRQVHEFNAGGAELFLISLKAGGTGLNLTGADTVIHYDPWWNPAVEDQASDRAYRIGQKNTVQVFKLVSRGTIEEKIFAMQQRKRKLVDSVIKPGENFLGSMTLDEVRGLFEA